MSVLAIGSRAISGRRQSVQFGYVLREPSCAITPLAADAVAGLQFPALAAPAAAPGGYANVRKFIHLVCKRLFE
jgi:hypothetical protein